MTADELLTAQVTYVAMRTLAENGLESCSVGVGVDTDQREPRTCVAITVTCGNESAVGSFVLAGLHTSEYVERQAIAWTGAAMGLIWAKMCRPTGTQ